LRASEESGDNIEPDRERIALRHGAPAAPGGEHDQQGFGQTRHPSEAYDSAPIQTARGERTTETSRGSFADSLLGRTTIMKRVLVVLAVLLLAWAAFVVLQFLGTCYGWWSGGHC